MLKVWKGDLQLGGGLPGGASTGGGWAQRQVYRSGSSGGLGQVGWSHQVIHLGLLSQRPNSSAHHQVMPSGCRLEAWVMFQQEDGDGPPFSWWESPGPLRCTGQSRASPHLPLSSSQE